MDGQKRRAALLAAAAALAGAAEQASAVDFGLGAAFDESQTVIIPIRTNSWLIEPQLAYSNSKFGGSTTKVFAPAVGVYYRKDAGPLFEAYYGGSLGFGQFKQSGGQEQSTFSIAGTVGVQHYLSKQFSLGLDASLKYTDGTTKQAGLPDQDTKVTTLVTRIVLRAYLW